MNQKINEFAEKCEGITICECGSTGFNYEKFATMIILECAEKSYRIAWDALVNDEPESVIPHHIHETLLEHFGIEE